MRQSLIHLNVQEETVKKVAMLALEDLVVFHAKEYEDDIVFSYLEVTGIDELNSIEVVNEILFDVLPKQQNIVKVKAAGKYKSFILIPANKSRLLNFN